LAGGPKLRRRTATDDQGIILLCAKYNQSIALAMQEAPTAPRMSDRQTDRQTGRQGDRQGGPKCRRESGIRSAATQSMHTRLPLPQGKDDMRETMKLASRVDPCQARGGGMIRRHDSLVATEVFVPWPRARRPDSDYALLCSVPTGVLCPQRRGGAALSLTLTCFSAVLDIDG
jgi:hypothetical protein